MHNAEGGLNMPNIYCDGGNYSGGISRDYYSGSHYSGSSEGPSLITLIINGILGLVLLYLANLLPFVHIPINTLTVLFTFFTGILGVVILTIASVVGFI